MSLSEEQGAYQVEQEAQGADSRAFDELLASGAVLEMLQEYERARSKFAPFRSAHEGLAVLWEEFEELKLEVFHSPFAVEMARREAVQVAAMALAFILECTASPSEEQGA